MQAQKIIGTALFFAPALIWMSVEASGYEWIWNRTDYSIAAGCAAAMFSFAAMLLGIYLLERKKLIGRAIIVGCAVCFVQLYNIGLDGFAQMKVSESFGEGRKAFSLRYATFGKSWTDVYLTQEKWGLFRKTKHIRQYDDAVVTHLRQGFGRTIEIHLTEYGKPDRIDSYSMDEAR
jgi:hypothetical protein